MKNFKNKDYIVIFNENRFKIGTKMAQAGSILTGAGAAVTAVGWSLMQNKNTFGSGSKVVLIGCGLAYVGGFIVAGGNCLMFNDVTAARGNGAEALDRDLRSEKYDNGFYLIGIPIDK